MFTVRVIDKEKDKAKIEKFYEGLSRESLRRRFHGTCNQPWKYLDYYSNKDSLFALLAIMEDEVVGIAEICTPTGEISFAVADQHQRQGIGTCLCAAILKYALECRVQTLCAEILAYNTPAVKVFQRLGFKVVHREGDELTLRLE